MVSSELAKVGESEDKVAEAYEGRGDRRGGEELERGEGLRVMNWGEFAVSVLTSDSGCTGTVVRDASICIFVLPCGFVETEPGTRTV